MLPSSRAAGVAASPLVRTPAAKQQRARAASPAGVVDAAPARSKRARSLVAAGAELVPPTAAPRDTECAAPPRVLTAETLDAAVAALAASDPKLAELVRVHGAPHSLLQESIAARGHDAFASLARSIAYQQLATKAANTIWGRVLATLGGDACVTPERVLATSPDSLRAAGLSGRKAEYMHGLAAAFADGRLDGSKLASLPDAAVEQALVAIRGFGPWSAHMFLIFGLNRCDVLPWGDYGVRKSYAQLYKRSSVLPSRAELEQAAAAWAPHRSLAAWYLWRALDAAPVPKK